MSSGGEVLRPAPDPVRAAFGFFILQKALQERRRRALTRAFRKWFLVADRYDGPSSDRDISALAEAAAAQTGSQWGGSLPMGGRGVASREQSTATGVGAGAAAAMPLRTGITTNAGAGNVEVTATVTAFAAAAGSSGGRSRGTSESSALGVAASAMPVRRCSVYTTVVPTFSQPNHSQQHPSPSSSPPLQHRSYQEPLPAAAAAAAAAATTAADSPLAGVAPGVDLPFAGETTCSLASSPPTPLSSFFFSPLVSTLASTA
jgi:hypothetical protein